MDILKEIENLIKNNINNAIVEVSDLTGNINHLHLGLIVASDDFSNISLLQQHKKVMDILREKLQADVHAIKLKTMTRSKYIETKETL